MGEFFDETPPTLEWSLFFFQLTLALIHCHKTFWIRWCPSFLFSQKTSLTWQFLQFNKACCSELHKWIFLWFWLSVGSLLCTSFESLMSDKHISQWRSLNYFLSLIYSLGFPSIFFCFLLLLGGWHGLVLLVSLPHLSVCSLQVNWIFSLKKVQVMVLYALLVLP